MFLDGRNGCKNERLVRGVWHMITRGEGAAAPEALRALEDVQAPGDVQVPEARQEPRER